MEMIFAMAEMRGFAVRIGREDEERGGRRGEIYRGKFGRKNDC